MAAIIAIMTVAFFVFIGIAVAIITVLFLISLILFVGSEIIKRKEKP